MIKIFSLALFVCFSLLARGVSADSYVKDFFLVKGIPATASSVSSSDAKKKVLDIARTKAFNVVLSRILLSEDVAKVIVPESYNMEKFVQSVKLGQEKTSSVSYSANVDIEMNKSLVEAYLTNQGISFVSDVPPSVLIIVDADTQNNFAGVFSAFDEYNSDKNVVRFIVAGVGDVLPASLSGRAKKLSGLMELSDDEFNYLRSKYNVEDVVIVGFPMKNGVSYDAYFKGRLFDFDKRFSVKNSFACDAECIVGVFMSKLNDVYKQASLSGELNNDILLVVPLYSLADWISVKNKFSKMPAFKDMVVQALKFNKAQIKIKYRYDLSSVISALTLMGYSVDNKGEYLILKR